MKRLLCAIVIYLLFTVKAFSFTQIVTVKNHVFTPANFTINLGDTIKWTWINGSHTTTSLTIPAGAATWDHNINSSSTSFVYVPSVTGTYNFKCTPHFFMGMKGTFIVVCPGATAQISAGGAIEICKGASVLLSSTVSANIISFQWKKDGADIANATSATFTATVTGSYTLTVTNNCGSTVTSNAISVTVNKLPKAVITPSDTVTICKGDSVTLKANTGSSQTYQWDKNGTLIPGANSSTYTAKTAGSYRVTVTKTTTGCRKKSAQTKVVVNTCLNAVAARSASNAISIFPNPSSHDFHILLPPDSNEQYFISIFDAEGNSVSGSKIISKDFRFGSELKGGIYLVQIKNNNTVILEKKIIKE